MTEFYKNAFGSVHVEVDAAALDTLTYYAAGFPRIMHVLGNAAFWLDRDGRVDRQDAVAAVMAAAEQVGSRYVDKQVYQALRSKDYQSILRKIGKLAPDAMAFNKKDVEKGLTDTEKRVFNNFLQKMKRLKVLRSGDVTGEYEFTMRRRTAHGASRQGCEA